VRVQFPPQAPIITSGYECCHSRNHFFICGIGDSLPTLSPLYDVSSLWPKISHPSISISLSVTPIYLISRSALFPQSYGLNGRAVCAGSSLRGLAPRLIRPSLPPQNNALKEVRIMTLIALKKASQGVVNSDQ